MSVCFSNILDTKYQILDTISMNEVEQIKDSIDIVEFVKQYVELQRAGSNWRGLCPFHSEKTPSFMVSADKQIFKCFGCSEGGDVFEFLMKIEGLSFPEALQMLADKAGVQLPQRTKPPKEYAKEKDTKSAIFKINDLSSKVFTKILVEHKSADIARKYLTKRKIDNKTIDEFKIGYIPNGGILSNFLIKRGFNREEINRAGSPDRFYKRIMFPIFDRLGNVVAFTGRTIEKDMEPKYLNTAETIVFHKSKTLYGLNIARDSIRKKGYVILVEGQMDVVLSHKAGVKNVVATSGTAITSDHLKILMRYGADIVFCFDRDTAGQNAAKKAIKMAYEADVSPYIIDIPIDFKDVGDIVEKDEKIWQQLSRKRKPALEWLLEIMFSKYGKDMNTNVKKTIVKEFTQYLILISDPMEFKHYKKAIASHLSVTERIIDEILEKVRAKNGNENNSQTKKVLQGKITEEEFLIGLVLSYPRFIKLFIDNLNIDSFQHEDIKTVYKTVGDCYNLRDAKTLSDRDLPSILECIEKKLLKDLYEKVKFFVMEVQEKLRKVSDDEVDQVFSDYIARLKGQSNKKIKEEFAHLISQAEEKKDIGEVKKLLKKFQDEISKK